MPERKRRLLPASVLGVLRSGFRDRNQICAAQRDTSGAPCSRLFLTLSDEGLVDVQNWTSSLKAGDVIGLLTEHGWEVFRRGWL